MNPRKHRPPTSREGLFNRLLEEAQKNKGGNSAGPFVAVAGKGYSCDNLWPRLMFCGKATYGTFKKGGNLREPTFRGQEELALDILENGAGSCWWSFISGIVRQVFADKNMYGSMPQDLPRHMIVWNNLMKAGVRIGNPKPPGNCRQSSLAADFLDAEVCEFRPTHIIIPTSNYAVDFIEGYLAPIREWKLLPDLSAADDVLNLKRGDTHFIWCKHPQGKKLHLRERWEKAIADFVKSTPK